MYMYRHARFPCSNENPDGCRYLSHTCALKISRTSLGVKSGLTIKCFVEQLNYCLHFQQLMNSLHCLQYGEQNTFSDKYAKWQIGAYHSFTFSRDSKVPSDRHISTSHLTDEKFTLERN